MVNLGLEMKMTAVTDQPIQTVALQSHTAPRRALHERPLPEARGSAVFISQFDAGAPAASATVHASICLQERAQRQGTAGKYPHKFIPGSACSIKLVTSAFPASSQGHPNVRVAQPGPSVRCSRLLQAPWRSKAA